MTQFQSTQNASKSRFGSLLKRDQMLWREKEEVHTEPAQDVNAPGVQATSSVPDARASAPAAPRSRFGGLVAAPAGKQDQANSDGVGEAAEAGPAVVESGPKGRFDAVVDHSTSAAATTAKVNIAAVKALTPLVASISFFPGNSAEPTMKSAALAALIVKVQKAADDLVLAMTPTISNVEWARGQIMQELARIAAKQWETRGKVDLDTAVDLMRQVLREPGVEFAEAIDAYAYSDKYMEARTPEVAQGRIGVSISSAAWELYDWLTHEGLRLPQEPGKVFSYERGLDDVVEIILGRCIDEARGMQIQVKSTDLQIAHLQGSIRRLVQLAGAEYVTQTRAIMSWMDAEEIDDTEQARRRQTAIEQFETHVVPRIMAYVHVNFVGIEHRARKLMSEKTDEKSHEDRPVQ